MLKRNCKGRAEWRLQLGKPAERLSPHYRLDCDYGMPVVTCWEEGGSEPLYLCESHAKELERRGASSPGARAIADQSAARSSEKLNQAIVGELRDVHKENGDGRRTQIVAEVKENPAKGVERTQTLEAGDTKPKGTPSPQATGSFSNARVGRAMRDPSPKSPARDLTYGNPAKAMVDEAIWNMATGDFEAYRTARRQGKSDAEAAQAAGGQLAMVHRKIAEYTLKLAARLLESEATIDSKEALDKPLEQAMLEIISKEAASDAEKDAAIQQLGLLEGWLKRGLNGNMAPIEANRIMKDIGDRLNWGGSSEVPEALKPAYRLLFASLTNAIRTAVPEAHNLHERLTNLYAAKSDLDNHPATKESNPQTA